MPVYEYLCKGCGHEFEREQRISEAPIEKCPKCGKAKARRLISRTSFVLKGGGWYNDLYATKPGKPAAEGAEAKTDAKTDAKSDAKADAPAADSKTETKAEPAAKSEKPAKGPKKGGKGAKSAA
jgi:putative FmdB family regulatory protein